MIPSDEITTMGSSTTGPQRTQLNIVSSSIVKIALEPGEEHGEYDETEFTIS